MKTLRPRKTQGAFEKYIRFSLVFVRMASLTLIGGGGFGLVDGGAGGFVFRIHLWMAPIFGRAVRFCGISVRRPLYIRVRRHRYSWPPNI